MREPARLRFWIVLVLLIGLHFSIRSRLGGDRIAPDFLLLALLTFTIRAGPGESAVAGFCVGLVGDALTPASFGAGMLAHTLVAYLSSWAKAVFFAENLLVNGVLFFAGTWVRNALVAFVSGRLQSGTLGWELLVWSPLQGVTTALAGVLMLALFRGWLAVRLGDA